MRDLIAALRASVDPRALVGRIAEQMCLITPKADGAAVAVLTPGGTFAVVSAHGLVTSLLGETFPQEGTLVGAAVRTGRPQVSTDAATDDALLARVRGMSSHVGVGSFVAIPLLHRGHTIGALSMSARQPHTFTERDIAAMAAAGRFISALIDSHTELAALIGDFLTDPSVSGTQDSAARFLASLLVPDVAHDEDMHRRLDDVLSAPAHLLPVFQPIIELASGDVVGYEGLSRFPLHGELTPWQWFDLARRLGRSRALELHALHQVLADAHALPQQCFLAVNLSPLTATEPAVHALLGTLSRPLVIEVTEHEPFPDSLPEALMSLRANSIRLAIDDVGAGYASFNQLLRLTPDFIKIDGTLIRGIDADPVKRALVAAIAQLAGELHATTIAEMVETTRQHHVLRELGIHCGQGYHYGRPAPVHATPPLPRPA